MYECSEGQDGENMQQDDRDTQAVELSIVILVDGEEKCSTKVGKGGVRPCSSNRSLGNNGQQSTSRPSTPTSKSCPSATSLPPCNKKAASGRYQHDCPYENHAVDQCGNCGLPYIVPTPQSLCPCAAFQNAPCGGATQYPVAPVKSQTAACQTVTEGQCQTDPVTQNMEMQACMQAQSVAAPVSQVPFQSSACQTGSYAPAAAPPAPAVARPGTPKCKKVCRKKAKSAICQTQAQPMALSRPQTAEQTNQAICPQVQAPPCCAQVQAQPSCLQVQAQPSCHQVQAPPSCHQVQAPPSCHQVQAPPSCSQVQAPPSCSQVQAPPICQPVPVDPCVPIPVCPPGCIPATASTAKLEAEQAPPMEEPTPIGDVSQVPRSKEDKVRKVRRSSKEEKLREPPEARKARKSSLPPDQLNFSHFPQVQLNFVDYFLKSEGGVTSVITLAETKLEYEKKCKSVLANMPNHKRTQAEEFFNKIIEAIQVKVPESNNTEIKHYHLVKYLQPIITALNLHAHDELHVIHKYHAYILSVVNFMEERLRQREIINPDAMVDVETHLLAGIMSRIYPIFIKMKDTAIQMSKGSSHAVPSDEFVRQLRKLILASYVEIVCIDVTFNNTLTSLSYLPSVDVQEKYRHQMAIRKKHARHSVTWAARCITTALLYYHIGSAIGI